MDLLKFYHGFVKVITWIFQSWTYFRYFDKHNQAEVWPDFTACWSFCFELEVLIGSKHLMPWVHWTFGKALSLSFMDETHFCILLALSSDTFVSPVLGKETTGHKSLLQFCNCHHVLMDRFVVGTLFNVHFIHVTHLWNWGPHLKHFQCDIFFEVLLLCSCHSP